MGLDLGSILKGGLDPGSLVSAELKSFLPSNLQFLGGIAGAITDAQMGNPTGALSNGMDALKDLQQQQTAASTTKPASTSTPAAQPFKTEPPPPPTLASHDHELATAPTLQSSAQRSPGLAMAHPLASSASSAFSGRSPEAATPTTTAASTPATTPSSTPAAPAATTPAPFPQPAAMASLGNRLGTAAPPTTPAPTAAPWRGRPEAPAPTPLVWRGQPATAPTSGWRAVPQPLPTRAQTSGELAAASAASTPAIAAGSTSTPATSSAAATAAAPSSSTTASAAPAATSSAASTVTSLVSKLPAVSIASSLVGGLLGKSSTPSDPSQMTKDQFMALGNDAFMQAVKDGKIPKEISDSPAAMQSLQARMNSISEMNQLMTSMLTALHQMEMSIIQNVRV
ncbi:MAG TPA: hypothetical protein VHJ20_20050 [Polyangia bacterium]|nr:hypothetical protein [Polyangia bacterium]